MEPTQQPLSPAPTSAPATATPPQNSDPTTKKINNAGSSVFWLGIVLTVLFILGILGSLVTKDASHRIPKLIFIVLDLVLAICMIVYGRRLKPLAQVGQALPILTTTIFLSLGMVIFSVIESIIVKSNLPLQGFLALIALIYLIVARVRLSKLTR